jgi:hypothetical protein
MNPTSNGNDDGGIWIAVTVTPCVYLAPWIAALVRGRPPCGHSFVDTGRAALKSAASLSKVSCCSSVSTADGRAKRTLAIASSVEQPRLIC